MKNEKLIRNVIVATTAVIIGILMIIFKETGLFYILCAAAIVFVVWSYAHEESLNDFENRVWMWIKSTFRRKNKRFKREIIAINRENKKRRALGGNRAHGNMKKQHLNYNDSHRKSQIKERIK